MVVQSYIDRVTRNVRSYHGRSHNVGILHLKRISIFGSPIMSRAGGKR